MRVLKGIPVSPGIAIGRLQVLEQEEHIIREIALDSPDKVRREAARFKNALGRSRRELAQVRKALARRLGNDEAAILDAQIRLLDDPSIVGRTLEAVAREKKNAAFLFKRVVEETLASLQAVKDKYLADRVHEIRDIYHRVLNHLLEDFAGGSDSIGVRERLVLAARSLPPYEFVHFERGNLLGVVTALGGRTSHFSIIARAFDVPAVVGCEDITRYAKSGRRVIVDGFRGRVILDPDRATMTRYEKSRERWLREEQELMTLRDLPPVTIDGKTLDIAANIELPSEINSVIGHGCRNIGLCRTEFLFMLKNRPPTEDEQTAIYADYLSKMRPGYVIIRTLDIGGDKLSAGASPENAEPNPALGFRAIRMCLGDRALFRTQLRAILRASVHGHLKIMFPMISTLEETRRVLAFYRQVKAELMREKVPVAPRIDMGIMIEVPSAALAADALAAEVDFFSVGTNDLAQFILAVDRGNKRVAHLYDPFNPSLLRLIHHTFDAAHRKGIWAGVCGEMAGQPLSALLLLGMGADELSMNSVSMLGIKRIIRAITFDELRALAEEALALETSADIRLFLIRELSRKLRLRSKFNLVPTL